MNDTDTTIRTFRHPGAGRRHASAHPKGRQLDPAAEMRIRRLLSEDGAPHWKRRDMLIENLHLIQDRYGFLHADHLLALADAMALAIAEVYEVASFYAHFDIVDAEESGPPSITIRVCDSLTCAMAGAEALSANLHKELGPSVRVVRAPCMGRCGHAPVAQIGQRHAAPMTSMTRDEATKFASAGPDIPDYPGLEAYMADNGYRLLDSCRGGERTPEALIEILEDAGLRGLGGAGFPVGRKWQAVRAEQGPRLMAINADEGEPGTFKDHYYLIRDPHRFLEGMLIAAWSVDADEIYVYLRDEYPDIRRILEREIAAVESAGLNAGIPIHLRRGAGAYICGEESAMLESIEGKRGLPRHKPPFPSQVGLFGKPTLIHNVETVYWIREIAEKGADWFAAQGRNGCKGLRSFSVSGRVKLPGVKCAPAGITARELIDEYCGGMAKGHQLKAYLPGGASGGILPAQMADIPLDFGTLEQHGCFIGSAAVIVLSDQDDLKAAALNLMRFFEDESCGQCTPCRVGTEKSAALMSRPDWDKPLLEELSRTMADASICGLGQAAANPMLSLFRYFPEAL